MFSKHLIKVIVGFCGVILLGLISLVLIDSFKDREIVVRPEEKPANTSTVQTPQIKTQVQTPKIKHN